MLNKLDPARKGMPWCMMTEDERQLLRDADASNAMIRTLLDTGSWRLSILGLPGPKVVWTDWERPAKTVEQIIADIRAKHYADGLDLVDGRCEECVFYRVGGKECRATFACGDETCWKKKPAAPAQPANLPAGWIAYPVTWSVSHGGVLTWANGGTTDVQNCHIGMQNLGGGFLCCWVIGDDYKSKSFVPCGSGHFAKWAVFRPLEVTP